MKKLEEEKNNERQRLIMNTSQNDSDNSMSQYDESHGRSGDTKENQSKPRNSYAKFLEQRRDSDEKEGGAYEEGKRARQVHFFDMHESAKSHIMELPLTGAHFSMSEIENLNELFNNIRIRDLNKIEITQMLEVIKAVILSTMHLYFP